MSAKYRERSVIGSMVSELASLTMGVPSSRNSNLLGWSSVLLTRDWMNCRRKWRKGRRKMSTA